MAQAASGRRNEGNGPDRSAVPSPLSGGGTKAPADDAWGDSGPRWHRTRTRATSGGAQHPQHRLHRKPPRPLKEKRHHVFVRGLQGLLVTLAVALIAASIYLGSASQSGPGRATNIILRKPDSAARAVDPRLVSRDAKGRPYTITAKTAVKRTPGNRLWHLKKPTADITLKNGSWLTLRARNGRYNKGRRHLRLREHVSLFHDNGFELHTSRAFADLEAGTVRSSTDVRGHGPAGTIRAEGLRISDNGKRILFTGRSDLKIHNSSLTG